MSKLFRNLANDHCLIYLLSILNARKCKKLNWNDSICI